MVKSKSPKEPSPRTWKLYCASFLMAWIPRIVIVILVISGYKAGLEYCLILAGNMPTPLQKLALDYSLSIVAGSAIFLLLYVFELKKIICYILNIKEVKLIEWAKKS